MAIQTDLLTDSTGLKSVNVGDVAFHYVYLLTMNNNIDSRRYYIGCRTSRCHPLNDTKYISSSKYVKEFVSLHGENNVTKKVLVICESREIALEYEIALHDVYNVAMNPEFFNMSKQTSIGWSTQGVTFSDEIREINRKSKIGINTWSKGRSLSFEHKEKIRLTSTNRLHTRESKEKMSSIKKAQSLVKCENCRITLTKQNYARYHGDNCIGVMYYSNVDGQKKRIKTHLGEVAPIGWTTQKSSYKDYMWITNGFINKKIKRGSEMLSGFVNGRCNTRTPEGVFV